MSADAIDRVAQPGENCAERRAVLDSCGIVPAKREFYDATIRACPH